MPVIDLISTSLGLVGKILAFIESNRIHKEFNEIEKLITKLKEEQRKPDNEIDDGLCDDLLDSLNLKLQLFQHEFGKELESKNLAALHGPGSSKT